MYIDCSNIRYIGKNNTISSLTRKETELAARMSYEKKDIVTAGKLDTYLPSNYPYRRKLVYNLKKKETPNSH